MNEASGHRKKEHDEGGVIAVNTPEQLGRIENRLIVETTHGGAVLVDPVSDTREMLPAIQCDEAVLEKYKMMLAEKVLRSTIPDETSRV